MLQLVTSRSTSKRPQNSLLYLSQGATHNGGGGGGNNAGIIQWENSGWISGEDLNTDGEDSFGREKGHKWKHNWPRNANIISFLPRTGAKA